MLEQTMDGLTAWLHVLGARQPSLLVVEDLHWVDPSTQELLSRLVGGRPPMAIVATSRRSGDPWLTRLGADEVRLGPLADTDCGALVRSMPMCGDLPPQVVELLVSRSDGVPLFAEELARMVGEQPFGEDGKPLGERDIPPS